MAGDKADLQRELTELTEALKLGKAREQALRAEYTAEKEALCAALQAET